MKCYALTPLQLYYIYKTCKITQYSLKGYFLQNASNKKYAVVDVETTGTSARYGKITEIAILVVDGHSIIDEFSTLLNPEQSIPPFITNLTGISDSMVKDAPKFYEVADQILALTRHAIFVGHNVKFDFGFVREEFQRLGYTYQRPRLCTVQLSRKIFPHQKSYSLGKLCHQLGIPLQDRHRAYGDARATVKLLQRLIDQDQEGWLPYFLKDFSTLQLPNALNRSYLQHLPQKPGVYYFYDEEGNPLYIGKSKNIKRRVFDHFYPRNNRQERMLYHWNDIDYTLTGTDLIAQLLESHHIKQYRPLYNRQQRRGYYQYGIFSYYDNAGYLRLFAGKITPNRTPLFTLPRLKDARRYLMKRVSEYHLCQKMCGLYNTDEACFHYQVDQCYGACIGEESPSSYNQRVQSAIKHIQQWSDNFVIIDKGRSSEERSVVLVENGSYQGFGYYDPQQTPDHINAIRDYIHSYPDNRDTQQIIQKYLRRNDSPGNVIKF